MGMFWRCGRSRTCSGSLTTLDEQLFSKRDTHNHPADKAELEAEKIVDAIRKQARETARPIPTVYHEEIQGTSKESGRKRHQGKTF